MATYRSGKDVAQVAGPVTITNDDKPRATLRPGKRRLCTPVPAQSALGDALLVAAACRTPCCPVVKVGFYLPLFSPTVRQGADSDVVESRTWVGWIACLSRIVVLCAC